MPDRWILHKVAIRIVSFHLLETQTTDESSLRRNRVVQLKSSRPKTHPYQTTAQDSEAYSKLHLSNCKEWGNSKCKDSEQPEVSSWEVTAMMHLWGVPVERREAQLEWSTNKCFGIKAQKSNRNPKVMIRRKYLYRCQRWRCLTRNHWPSTFMKTKILLFLSVLWGVDVQQEWQLLSEHIPVLFQFYSSFSFPDIPNEHHLLHTTTRN